MATLGWCICGRVSEFGDLLAGKQVRCTYCGEDLALPPAHACDTCATCAGKYEAAIGACPRCAPSQAASPGAPPAAPSPEVAPRDPTKCPSCGSPLSAGALMCRWCRKDLRVTKVKSAPPAPGPVPLPAAPLPAAPSFAPDHPTGTTYIPWEDDESLPPVSWWKTWWGAQFGFDRFWSRVPWDNGMMDPLKYFLFGLLQPMLLCALPLILLVTLVGMRSRDAGGPSSNVGCLVFLFMAGGYAVGAVASMFLNALICHGVLKLLGGKGTFEATLRAWAYGSGGLCVGSFLSIPLGIIPVVGPLFSAAVTVGLMGTAQTFAFSHAHQVGKGPAAAAAFGPPALCCLSIAGLVILAIAGAFGTIAG